ncbi:MAG: transglycosylase SLT domain-containing protein [Paramuribaculum sp.]|nr:transglycosylase SLT domain-containing protein [Paramuribaculum sp.]
MTLITVTVSSVAYGQSVLDVKHTKTDDNIVPPESYEIQTQQLLENYYLKNYTAAPYKESGEPRTGNDKEYEDMLKRLPTIIEMPYNPVVGKYIDMYLGKRRDLVATMLALHNNYYGDIFVEALEREGLPLELQYLPVIESALNPNAVSRAGAAGLWQFMPSTATGMGMEVNSLVDERRDPRVASHHAAKYLKQLYNIYGDWSLAIAAYNCGPGNLNKALRRAGGGKKDFWEIYDNLLPETRGYVPIFIAANYVMNYHNRYGIKPLVVSGKLAVDTIEVADRVHFNQISGVLDIPVEEIRLLNPQYRKDIIPGDVHPYKLALPSQQCLSYIMSRQQILDYDADKYGRRSYVALGEQRRANGLDNQLAADGQTQNCDSNVVIDTAVPDSIVRVTHIVKRGENLRDIAKQYGVSATDVKRWNNLRRGKVKENDELVIEIYKKTVEEASIEPLEPSTVTTDVTERSRQKQQTQSEKKKTPRPPKPATVDKKPASVTHTVKSGDTLEKIAKKYGVTVAEIRAANGIKANSSLISIGQKLKIPQKGSAGQKPKTSRKKRR